MISSFSTNSFSWSAASSSADFAAAAGLGGMVYHHTRINRVCSQIPRGYVSEHLTSECRKRELAHHVHCDRLDVISGLPSACRALTLTSMSANTIGQHVGNLNRVAGCTALGFCSCRCGLHANLPNDCKTVVEKLLV
jgi:hypothetical protein